MDSPVNNSKAKLDSTFELFETAIYISFDWNQLRNYVKAFILPGVIYLILVGFPFISSILFPEQEALMNLITVPIISPFLLVALLGILYSFNLPRVLSLGEIYIKGFKLLFPFLWLAVLNILIILIGLCLFIIPGIYWSIKYSLSIGILVFEGKRGFQALHRSKALTEQRFFYLLINYGVCIAVILLIFLAVFYLAQELNIVVKFFSLTIPVIFGLAFYYCSYKQLHSRNKLTIDESSL